MHQMEEDSGSGETVADGPDEGVASDTGFPAIRSPLSLPAITPNTAYRNGEEYVSHDR